MRKIKSVQVIELDGNELTIEQWDKGENKRPTIELTDEQLEKIEELSISND